MVNLEKPRRRSSVGPTPTSSRRVVAAERKNDEFGEIATRRRSTGFDSFDPFDLPNNQNNNTPAKKNFHPPEGNHHHQHHHHGVEKKKGHLTHAMNHAMSHTSSSSSAGSEPFDPFAFGTSKAALEQTLQKKQQQGAPKTRKTPARTQSAGAGVRPPISMADIFAKELKKEVAPVEKSEEELMFDKIDWNHAKGPRSPRAKSRRHSIDSRPQGVIRVSSKDQLADEFQFEDPFKSQQPKKQPQVEEEEKRQQQQQQHHMVRKKRNGKSRRQSLDSALSFPEEDGFGPVKTYGYDNGSTVGSVGTSGTSGDRRRGMARSKSGTGDNLSIASWKSEKSGEPPAARGPKGRGLHRRSSETTMMRRMSASKSTMDYHYDTETTATHTTNESVDSSFDSRVLQVN